MFYFPFGYQPGMQQIVSGIFVLCKQSDRLENKLWYFWVFPWEFIFFNILVLKMISTKEKPEELDRIQKRVNKILEARLESDKVSPPKLPSLSTNQ